MKRAYSSARGAGIPHLRGASRPQTCGIGECAPGRDHTVATSPKGSPMKPMTRSSRTATLAVACIATAMLMLDISVINTALSNIASGLKTGLSGLQWVLDAYTLPLATTVLTAGAVADRLGRRRLFVIGMVVFTAA